MDFWMLAIWLDSKKRRGRDHTLMNIRYCHPCFIDWLDTWASSPWHLLGCFFWQLCKQNSGCKSYYSGRTMDKFLFHGDLFRTGSGDSSSIICSSSTTVLLEQVWNPCAMCDSSRFLPPAFLKNLWNINGMHRALLNPLARPTSFFGSHMHRPAGGTHC